MHNRGDIGELLAHHGLAPRRDLGQNFVADANTVRRIARLAEVGPGDRVQLDDGRNLRISGGLFPAAGTRWQRAAGIDDRPQYFAEDQRLKAPGAVNEAILEAVTARGVDAADFLADVAGIEVHLLKEVVAPGHRVPRLHASPGESGRDLLALMREIGRAHV